MTDEIERRAPFEPDQARQRATKAAVPPPAIDCVWIDASGGAAGDMLLGALLDAGASLERVREAVARIANAAHERIAVDVHEVRRHGLRASKADVTVVPTTASRTLGDLLGLADAARLEPAVASFAAAAFRRLGRAEARAHGEPDGDAVHLHEVGALDAIADVIGTGAALDSLGLLAPRIGIVVGEVAVGSGTAQSRHGQIPVPAPAVLEILRSTGAAISTGRPGMELCTPTGAALLASVATGWGDLPPMRIAGVGIGAGSADPPDRANVLRVVLGTAVRRAGDRDEPRDDQLIEIEATVDDQDPRTWPDVLDACVLAGAADAWLTPAVMRKGRPGHVVTALAPAGVAEAVARVLFTDSTTLGVRMRPVSRQALPRDDVVVQVEGCDVRVKRGFLDGEAITIQPEYADALAVARRLGRPVRWVLERASVEAHATPGLARDAALPDAPVRDAAVQADARDEHKETEPKP